MHELDELNLIVVMDNETDTLSSLSNSEQMSEASSILDRHEPDFERDGHPCTSVFDHMCCACHGFSVLVTGHSGADSHTVLFDVGPYGDVWLDNAVRLGVDLAAIESVFLSHWHWDHSGGLVAVIDAIASARRAAGLAPPVLDLHPQRPEQRGVALPDGAIMLLPPDPTFDELTDAGAELVFNDTDHAIANGFFLGSGEIPRLSSFETGLVGHQTLRDGKMVDDPLITDERCFAAKVRGRGVTVLSACSHAGIINATGAALAAAGTDQLDLVLGGYHLAGKQMEPRIPATVDALADLNPRLVGPGHCTGWRAKTAMAQRFAPTDRYAPSVVGTRYNLD